MSEQVKKSRKKANPADRLPNPGPGRPKGSQNKFTSLKDSFLKAFEEIGGTEGLVEWAKKNSKNRERFYQMITKMLPSSLDVDMKGRIEAVILSDKFLPKDDGSKPKQGA